MASKVPITEDGRHPYHKPPETTVFQKLMIILGFVTVIVLCSLTASLPINLPRNQGSMDIGSPPTASIDNGDTAWMIVASMFAILLGPVVAYFYANIYGKSSNTLVQTVIIMASMVAFLWIIITLSLVWGRDANGGQIMGFPKQFYMFAHAGNLPIVELANTIPMNIFAIFELSFAILCPTIIAAAVIDRVNVYGFLAFIFVWHITIWTPVAHIVWNLRGFFATNDIEDYAGGIVVHMMAGITVLAMNKYLDYKQAPKPEPAAPRNPESALFASFAVWFLWFGLNAGKAHSANVSASQSVVNTIAGVTVAIFINYLADVLFDVPHTNVAIMNAIMLGLVSTTPSSGFVTVGGAMVISIITTIVTRFFAKTVMKDGLQDQPYSVVSVHGIGGSVAFLFTALLSYGFVNPAAMNGLTYGHEGPIRHHVAAILALWPAGICAVVLCLFLVDLVVPLSRYDQHPKSDYAPTGLGPYRPSFKMDHPALYTQKSTFDMEAPK
jgi:Amt family ammonium transporter